MWQTIPFLCSPAQVYRLGVKDASSRSLLNDPGRVQGGIQQGSKALIFAFCMNSSTLALRVFWSCSWPLCLLPFSFPVVGRSVALVVFPVAVAREGAPSWGSTPRVKLGFGGNFGPSPKGGATLTFALLRAERMVFFRREGPIRVPFWLVLFGFCHRRLETPRIYLMVWEFYLCGSKTLSLHDGQNFVCSANLCDGKNSPGSVLWYLPLFLISLIFFLRGP